MTDALTDLRTDEPEPPDGQPARENRATATVTTNTSADASPSDDPRPAEAPTPHRWSAAWQRFVDMPIEGYITLFVVAACVIFVFVQLKPGLLFSDTTPAGGDMGAHVWAPAYLRDHLLTKGRLTGWTPDWYAGFPAFQFYMIVPSFVIAILSLVIPYGVAFKLVAVSGCVSLPFCAFYFGKMARLPFPAPALMSVAAMLFLFDRSFSIYGGNIPSTLAGEFAFSISLSFALLYLGVLARGLETGKYRAWAAVLFALTGLCHLIPFIFVMVCTVLWLVVRPGLAQLKFLFTAGPIGGLLVLFWMLPFYGQSGYMNDMGWEKIERYKDYLWDREKLDPQLVNVPDLKWVIAFAAVGLLLSLVYRRRAGVFLAMAAAVFALGFIYAPQGRLWNARLLPFYYLVLYLLAAIGIAELGRLLSALFARDVNRPIRSVAAITPVAGCLMALTMLGMSLQVMPYGRVDTEGVYRWGPFGLISTKDRSFVDSWAEWNFQGYEGWDRPVLKDAQGYPLLDADGNVRRGEPTYKKSYPEYYAIINTMKQVGLEKGCGRAMWEHEEQHDRYGTPMALMLLPFWTDGCIGSMEGLYFEASTTTPYHFLNQDELSWGPSNAQRDLPYGPGPTTKPEFDLGIKHLQLSGVTYYMAINDNTKALAKANPSLNEIATSGPWSVYSVADAPMVEALEFEPAVLVGQPTIGRPWQDTAVCWYQNEASWDVFLAADGPPSWQRVERTVIPDEKELPSEKCAPETSWGWFSKDGGPDHRAQKAVTVSTPIVTDDSITFDVSEPGVPVLVKASYFPNWKVSGAEGPYRVTPNFMVVVPTSTHVEMHYGYTGLDILAYLLTFIGLVGLFFLFKAKPLEMKPAWSFWGRAERPDLYPTAGPDLRFENEAYGYDAAAALAAVIPDFTNTSSYGYGYGVPVDHPPGSPPAPEPQPRLDGSLPTRPPEQGPNSSLPERPSDGARRATSDLGDDHGFAPPAPKADAPAPKVEAPAPKADAAAPKADAISEATPSDVKPEATDGPA